MYLDAYETEIIALLRKQFHRDNFVRLYPMIARYYNTFKKIVNLKSVIYKREAERNWYKSDGKTIDEKYNELINGSNIHSSMQLCNKLTNVNNASFVRIIPDVEKRTLKYAVVPGELINVTQDPNDPSEITSILHRVTTTDTYDKLNNIGLSGSYDRNRKKVSYTSKYFYWDKQSYYILDSDLKPMMQDKNPENINPYGVIPYQLFTNLPPISGSIWNETVNDDLYSGTLQVNVLQTYLNNAVKLLGYLQIFIAGMDSEEAKGLDSRVSDALQPIIASDPNAKLTAVQMSNGVSEIKATIHDIMSEIADNHGVSYNARTNSAQKSSGMALAIEKEQIDNIREEQFPLYRESEKKLAYKSIIIANTDLGYNIDVNGKLAINFYEDKTEIPEKDKLLRDQFNLKNNIISVVDLYRENDPDVTDDTEVLQRIAQNKKINDELLTTYNFNMGSTDQNSDDNDEDQDTI